MNGVRRIKIPTELSQLARVFPVDLYIVGGYIRNQMLGIEQGDIDLCSSLSVDKLSKVAEECGFVIKHKNKAIGTAKLVYNDKVYDYATFRKEQYGDDKGHKPCEVEFIESPQEDAKRRDFTINAIYYNINKQSILDYFNGYYDLRRGIVRAIGNAEEVMANDGERILRMIRIAGELNFKIEKNTYNAAYKNVGNLYTLNSERLTDELHKIIYSDKKYQQKPRKSSFLNSLKHLNKFGVWKCLGLENEKINFNMIKKVEERVFGLLIDMVDTEKPASVSYFVTKILKHSAISYKRMDQVINIISGYYDALNKKSNKQYFFKYFDNFEQIFELLNEKSKSLALKYQFFYKYIISYHLVIKQSDLNISAKDLKEHFPSLPQKLYKEVFDSVLSDVFDGKYPNDRDAILNEIHNKMTITKN